ncbi:MAG: hypothetical protein HYU64_18570, partial [Armatimonadetes bacterium]|nr:hypothetical protein [Armatimonadota bacterium]
QLSSLGTVISSDPPESALEENESVLDMQVLLQSEIPLSDLKTKLSRLAETQVTFKEKEEAPHPVQTREPSPARTGTAPAGPSHLPSPWALGAAGEVFLLLSRKIAQLTQQEEQLEKLKENLRTRYPADHLVSDLTETARGIDHTVREMKGQIMAAYLGALKEKLQEVPVQVSALMGKLLAEVEAVSDVNMETFEAELDRLIAILTDLRQDLRMLRS